ncbi:hypothetical protein ACGFY3_17760 [Streptomyces mirabilis]
MQQTHSLDGLDGLDGQAPQPAGPVVARWRIGHQDAQQFLGRLLV